eukprot:TRINITY_DN6207_c0_g1_i1.p1 TRINITY_DN6207_c0_g1~~TRINITY_DN6207_c0_g1_i1.p1  ORF type:complete len:842 (-),score=151.59 TRINITY_DN6207_c0_g1_i1:131-2656(-)
MDANEAGFVDLLHQHLLQGEVMDAEQILSIHGFKNYVGLNGNTTLHYATNAKSATLVRSLLEAGANPNACNHQGDSPLHLACYNGTVDLVEILVKFGSDVNKPGFGRLAPIHHAVQSRSIEICKFLIANGAHIDARDSTESTPLHIASRINDCFLAEFLVERGCFVNATDNELFTPLHVAASHGFEAMCRTLLAKGANAHALNRLQETPHQIAIHSQAHSVASLLAKHTRPSGVTATATTSSSTSRSIPVQGLATSSASALASIHRSPFTHISHAGPVSSSGSVSSITRPYAVAPGSVHASPQGSTRGYTSPSFHSATRSSTPTVPERVSSPRVFLSPPLSARHYNSTAVATTSSSSSSALERAYGHGQKYDFTPRDHLSGSASSSAYLGALVTPRAWANSRPEIPLSSNVPYSQNTRLTTMSESKIVIPRPSQQPSRHIAESQSHLLPNPNHGATTPNGLHKAEEKESHQSDQFPIGNMYQSVASLFPLQETEQSQETHSDTEIDVDTQKVSQVIETQSPNIQQQVEVVPVQDERQPQESHLSSATMNPQPTPEPEVKQESLPSARSSSAFVSPLSQVVIKQVYTDYNPDPVVEISEPSASPLPNNTATITTIEPARPLSLHVQGGFGLASPAAPRMYGALSFDIEQVKEFVMSPGPATLHECTIRKRFIDGHDAYVLIEESTGKHLLTAFKKINSRTSNYAIILTNNYVRRKHPNYLGKLRGNFLRNTYNMYDKGSNPARTSQDMAISTCRSELGMVMISEKSPRNMSILIPIIHNNQHLSIVPMRKSETLKNRYDRHGEDPDIMILHSRLPTWHASKYLTAQAHFQWDITKQDSIVLR